VKEIVSTVLGGAAEVRLHGRNPLPGGGRQGLHADQPPAPGSDGPPALTLIWMLDDFTEHNGATRVVPGSHLRRSMVPRSLAQPMCSHPEECTLSGAAGDVVVMDSHLWHAGGRNASSGMRRSIQMIIGAST
jgi:ectoine hydroxylase-related dioxygenase (phytanoyl-CoA dioxygenase family)